MTNAPFTFGGWLEEVGQKVKEATEAERAEAARKQAIRERHETQAKVLFADLVLLGYTDAAVERIIEALAAAEARGYEEQATE